MAEKNIKLKNKNGDYLYPQTKCEDVIDLKATLLDMFYPVGSIYTSVNEISPETLFGGTWEQIKDVFLLAAGDTYTAGSTGGEATHTLTINEMPSHTHNYRLSYGEISSSDSNNHGKIMGASPGSGWNTSFSIDEGEIIHSTGGGGRTTICRLI